jgi:urea carboxylase
MLVKPGDRVERGEVIAVIEAMKTECDVPSPEAGIVRAIYAAAGQPIAAGAAMIALEPE